MRLQNNNEQEPVSPTSDNQLLKPKRPAPIPPKPAARTPSYHPGTTYTLSTYTSLDGVPFRLSNRIKDSPYNQSLPTFKEFKLTSEYDYNFTLEKQIVNV